MPLTKDEIIGAIKEMNVVDLADLVKSLEDEFGVTAAAPMAMAAAPAAEAAVIEEEEKDRVRGSHPRNRPQQNQRHQGRPRSHFPRPARS